MSVFVDVSGMSDQEVKRLGQMDNVEDVKSSKTKSRTSSVGYSVDTVWAAACAAQRVNGEYLKEDKYTYDTNGLVVSCKRRNRSIMLEFLYNPNSILPEDFAQGEQCRKYIEQDLTFRALKGQLTDFDNSVKSVLSITDRFYSVTNRYELAIVACLPASAAKSQANRDVVQRIEFASGGLFGTPGEKIKTRVEVLICNYSKQYNIFWVKGITDKDQPVVFSSKVARTPGTQLDIQGKVKNHRDKLTQLNYVKVL